MTDEKHSRNVEDGSDWKEHAGSPVPPVMLDKLGDVARYLALTHARLAHAKDDYENAKQNRDANRELHHKAEDEIVELRSRNEELSAQVALLSTRIARCIGVIEAATNQAQVIARQNREKVASDPSNQHAVNDQRVLDNRSGMASRMFTHVCYALTDAHPADRHKALDKLQADALRFIAHVVRTTLDAVGHTGANVTDEELAKRVSDVLEKGFGIRLSIAEQLYMPTDSKEKTDDDGEGERR